MKALWIKHLSKMFRSLFSSEKGSISSKRVAGMWFTVLTTFCILYLTLTEGGTPVVESLVSTCLFITASLLGIDSIVDIFIGRPKKGDAVCEN